MYRCLIAYGEVTGVFKNNEDLESKCKIFIKDYDNLVNERLAATPGKKEEVPGMPKALSPVQPTAQSPLGQPGATKVPSPVHSPAESPGMSPNPVPFKGPDQPPKDAGEMPQ
uniref:Uncharacterized protein n=1 Tax=Panagrolaimus sp. JU765 TaxID=591449 RepID=A0AC34QDC6_9BILA